MFKPCADTGMHNNVRVVSGDKYDFIGTSQHNDS
jgi:hypothetical protein